MENKFQIKEKKKFWIKPVKNVEEKFLCTLHWPGEFNKDIAKMFSV